MARSDHVLFLAENVCNTIQFPRHVVSDPSGSDPDNVFRVGTSRRSDQSVYTGLTDTNLQLRVEFDRVRSIDTVVLDRNCLLVPGMEVEVRLESGTAYQLIEGDIPADVVQGASVDDPPHWIKTEEGVHIIHFPPVACISFFMIFRYSGTGVTGKIGGVYAGKSYRPTYPRLPFDDAARWADFGVVRRGVPNNDIRTGRSAAVSMMMRDEQEWDRARWQVRQLFGRGHPMWFIPNASRAERAWLAYNVDGQVSAPFSERPQGRSVSVNLEEYDPVLP